jgi:hypothetical protein
LVTNDEDLVTCESKETIRPFDYFGFEENGKVWCFSFPSLWKWAVRSHQPVNPYTKVPLDIETRKRMHEYWAYRHRHRLDVPEEPTVLQERIRARWNVLCQMFDNYHFGDITNEFTERILEPNFSQYLTRERNITNISIRSIC